MTANKGSFEPSGLVVAYKPLGTISIKELRDALIEDCEVLKDLYNVRYVKNARLRVYVTDERGNEIKLRRRGGGRLHYLETHHFRPACKDYDL